MEFNSGFKGLRFAFSFQATSYARPLEQTHGVTHIIREIEGPTEQCHLLSNGVNS